MGEAGSAVPTKVRIADAMGLVLTLGGESLSAILGVRATVGWFSPFFVAGVAILAIRHVTYPSPNVLRRARSWLFYERGEPSLRRVAKMALFSRVAVLAAGLTAAALVGYTLMPLQPRFSHNELWNLPGRWDAGWYLGIAREGYEWRPELEGRQQPIAFFPLYPGIVRIAGDLVTVPAKLLQDPDIFGNGNTRVLWGGVLVSIACFVFASQRIYLIARHYLNPELAVRSVLLMAAYPFALFFGATYSEALFLLCLSSTVLAWLEGNMRSAFLWGVATGLARSNGWTAALALASDAVIRKRGWRAVGASTGPLAGMGAFSMFVYWLTGDPWSWARAQEAWGRTFAPFDFITRRATSISDHGLIGYITREPVDAITAVATAMSLVLSGVLLGQRKWLLGILAIGYILPAILIDLPAAGRMTAVVFPLFICLASLIHSSRVFWAVAGVMWILQLALAMAHYTWRPPY